MSFVDQSKWTCPRCSKTVVVYGSPDDVRCCVAAVQLRHAAGHRKAADVLGRLGLPEPKAKNRKTTLRRRAA